MVKFNTLYKRSTTGKVSTWFIEIEGNKFRTVSGFLDGLKVISDWTVCESKSYCTAEEQAIKQATSLHKKKIELGAFENINDIDNPVYFSPMLANDWDKEKIKAKFPLYSQGKLDGIRCIIKYDGMWTRKGKPIISAPHIFNAIRHVFEIYPDLILDGELFTDKLSNDFNKIVSCVRKTKPTQEDLEESARWIEYWIYDFVDAEERTFKNRTHHLESNIFGLKEIPYIKILPTYLLKSKEEVNSQFAKYIEQGYEGQILRTPNGLYKNKRTSDLMKHKDFKTEEFTVVAVNEGVGKMANKAGTITIITNNDVLVNCAINGTHEYLGELWEKRDKLIGVQATVRFFDYTFPDLSLRFPKVIDFSRWDFE